ncbi:hypothetical protein IG631_24165 [Alternaria alternata]|nr:hypothetical protein IG631_24162 [Alternaria alternata]KAH8621183.1 hypothetical protein IG631_24165 [Alternaria alternata]
MAVAALLAPVTGPKMLTPRTQPKGLRDAGCLDISSENDSEQQHHSAR